MNKNQQKDIHELQYHYYYELAKKEPYIELGGIPYKYARFVHATLAEYDPVTFNFYGMTDQLEDKVISFSEQIAEEVSRELKRIPATITGNILVDTQSRNQTLLELEEIAKQSFVEKVKMEKYVFEEPEQKNVDTFL